MMKYFCRFIFLLSSIVFFVSCRSTEIAYIHDAPRNQSVPVASQFSKGIQPDDLLYIYVESEEAGATVPFNQETNRIAMREGVVLNANSAYSKVPGYLVDNNGDIIFPIFGKLHVAGLSHAELSDKLQKKLVFEGLIKDPTVTVKLLNFKVSVLGDVARPGQVVANGERMTIFEAISMAGDLTIYGQRQNVTVVREENGLRTVGQVDLSSKDIFESPFYYLHQNDVIYVEPNMRKKKNAERDPLVMTYISSAVSIISVLSTVAYQYILSKYYSR